MISESHGSPQIYFDFYKTIYRKITNNEELSFEEAYKSTSQKIVDATLKNFKGARNILRSLRLIVLPQPGSMKEIEIRANFKKLRYLLQKKRQLRNEFYAMRDLMYRVKRPKMFFSMRHSGKVSL